MGDTNQLFKNEGRLVGKEFSSFEVMRMLDVKRERLREWMNQGFTVPMLSARGAGTKAVFSIMDVYKIAVFKRLVESGINRKRAAEWVNTNPKLNDAEEVNELNYILLIEQNGGKWFSYMGEGPWNIEQDLQAVASWDVGVLINFKAIREDVHKGALQI